VRDVRGCFKSSIVSSKSPLFKHPLQVITLQTGSWSFQGALPSWSLVTRVNSFFLLIPLLTLYPSPFILHPLSFPLPPPMPKLQPKLLSFALLSTIALSPLVALAQSVREAKIVEILDGKQQVFIQDRVARENDVSTEGQVVRTAIARAGLLFAADAGIRLGRNSSLTVGSECVQLIQGEVMIAGTIGRNGCVGKLEVKTLGTVYIMRRDAASQKEQVIVLEGKVEIFNTDTPGVKVAVGAGQSVEATAGAGTLAPTQLSQAQQQAIAAPMVDGFQVPLPALARVAFLQRDPGFATTFLQDALVGREGNFSFDSQRGIPSLNIQPILSISGIFFRIDNNTGTFFPDSGAPAIPLAVDFNARTLSIGGVTGIANSAGLSGNNATGTVVLQNGQVVRLEVFNVNLREPPIDIPFRSTLTNGLIRDR